MSVENERKDDYGKIEDRVGTGTGIPIVIYIAARQQMDSRREVHRETGYACFFSRLFPKYRKLWLIPLLIVHNVCNTRTTVWFKPHVGREIRRKKNSTTTVPWYVCTTVSRIYNHVK